MTDFCLCAEGLVRSCFVSCNGPRPIGGLHSVRVRTMSSCQWYVQCRKPVDCFTCSKHAVCPADDRESMSRKRSRRDWDYVPFYPAATNRRSQAVEDVGPIPMGDVKKDSGSARLPVTLPHDSSSHVHRGGHGPSTESTSASAMGQPPAAPVNSDQKDIFHEWRDWWLRQPSSGTCLVCPQVRLFTDADSSPPF
jgi:hypothetical protein